MKRHLIYYLYARRGRGWPWQLKRLKKNWDLFTGRRRLVFTFDDATPPPEEVHRTIAGLNMHWDVISGFPNDQRFQETARFPYLLDGVQDEPGVTFYAHAKGVTRDLNRHRTVLPWTQFMYEALLSKRAIAALDNHACVGAFRRFGTWKRWGHGWSYPGTFFWFRNDQLQGDIKPTRAWWGVEQWPGKLWRPEQAAVLVKDDVQSLYRERCFNEEIVPAMDAWRSAA